MNLRAEEANVAELRNSITQYVKGLSGDLDQDDYTPMDGAAELFSSGGTRDLDAMDPSDVLAMLGQTDRQIAGMATRVCLNPSLSAWSRGKQAATFKTIMDDPLSPDAVDFHLLNHQLTAVVALVRWTITGECGFNFDAVGMGKTIVTLAHFVVLNNFRDFFRRTGRFPGAFRVFGPLHLFLCV